MFYLCFLKNEHFVLTTFYLTSVILSSILSLLIVSAISPSHFFFFIETYYSGVTLTRFFLVFNTIIFLIVVAFPINPSPFSTNNILGPYIVNIKIPIVGCCFVCLFVFTCIKRFDRSNCRVSHSFSCDKCIWKPGDG